MLIVWTTNQWTCQAISTFYLRCFSKRSWKDDRLKFKLSISDSRISHQTDLSFVKFWNNRIGKFECPDTISMVITWGHQEALSGGQVFEVFLLVKTGDVPTFALSHPVYWLKHEAKSRGNCLKMNSCLESSRWLTEYVRELELCVERTLDCEKRHLVPFMTLTLSVWP
jgi:hypothetical protein